VTSVVRASDSSFQVRWLEHGDELLARFKCHIGDLVHRGVELIEGALGVGIDLDGIDVAILDGLHPRGCIGARDALLGFPYRLEGDAPWKPIQVFDDGAKVYIQFPPGLAQSEAPPLFVIGPDGKPALVNYRVRGTTYIVDRLFAAAELRLGTAPQRVVRIVRTDAVWREREP
jgi:Conjugal transfer protein